MILDPVKILEEIVEREGDCDGLAGPATCKRCPLGNKSIDNKRVNCVEYVKALNASSEEANKIYKDAAQEELFAIELEKHLA